MLDREKTEVDFNGRWLVPLGADGIVRLAGRYTLARMLEREDFKTRFAERAADLTSTSCSTRSPRATTRWR